MKRLISLLKNQATHFQQKIIPQMRERILNLRRMKISAHQKQQWLTHFEKLRSANNIPTYSRMALIALGSYFLADTFSLFADYLVPDPPVVPPPPIQYTQQNIEKSQGTAAIEHILKRNIFNSRGIIPEDQFLGGVPRKTRLPLVLVGSMVFENELNSIATILDQSLNKTLPVQIDDVINGSLRITRIEERRVYFSNLNEGSIEYVEMPEESSSINLEVASVSGISKSGGVTEIAPNQYQVDRAYVDKSMTNLSELLRQARAVPNFENGLPTGYRILDIAQGSFFERIGLQSGDVLTAFNGEPVNDPAKALQLLNEIKTTDRAAFTIKRNGQVINNTVTIR